MSLRFLAVAVLGVAAQACAFTNLDIEPPRSVAPLPSVGSGREIALTTEFADRRENSERCGMMKNGYNMDTADVHCTLPPGRWLADALARGLNAAGYVVTAAPSPSATAARVDGELVQFFVEPKIGPFTFTPEADISVRLKLTTPSGLAAERVFYVKVDEPSAIGLEDNFQAAAEGATHRTVERMVMAITELLNRYPGAAAPTASAPDVVALARGTR